MRGCFVAPYGVVIETHAAYLALPSLRFRMPSNTVPPPKHGADTPDILTPSEAAKLLRVSRRHLQKLVAAGAIPTPTSISPRILRWKRDDLLAAL